MQNRTDSSTARSVSVRGTSRRRRRASHSQRKPKMILARTFGGLKVACGTPPRLGRIQPLHRTGAAARRQPVRRRPSEHRAQHSSSPMNALQHTRDRGMPAVHTFCRTSELRILPGILQLDSTADQPSVPRPQHNSAAKRPSVPTGQLPAGGHSFALGTLRRAWRHGLQATTTLSEDSSVEAERSVDFGNGSPDGSQTSESSQAPASLTSAEEGDINDENTRCDHA